MPIYEWQCSRGHGFELIAAISERDAIRQCPRCGAKSARVVSSFAIHRGATVATSSERAAARDVDVTQLKVPSFARPCGMDDFSAARLAAYKSGRGNEFDDQTVARKEREASRGIGPRKSVKSRAHGTTHHTHAANERRAD
jgi:putative FmdB family regulatory protein